MKTFEGIADAADTVRRWVLVHEKKIPKHIRERLVALTGTGSSPVDLVATFARAAYANRFDLPPEALEIAAGAAELCDRNGYHRDHFDARVLVPVLRRDSGERAATGRPWPKKKDDPVPDEEFLPAEGSA